MKEKLFELFGINNKINDKIKLASTKEVNDFMSSIDNKRLEQIEKNIEMLSVSLMELIKIEKDTQEYLVQLTTSIQEIEHILDTKVLIMNQVDNFMDTEQDPLSILIQKPNRKKMVN